MLGDVGDPAWPGRAGGAGDSGRLPPFRSCSGWAGRKTGCWAGRPAAGPENVGLASAAIGGRW